MSLRVARLEVVAGNATGMSVLVENELLIGRHAQGAGRLAEDPEISRSHARITLEQSGFCAVEDLGSTNGTFVNGVRINGPQTLSEGDTIELGSTTLVVRDLPGTPFDGAAQTPPTQATPVPGSAVAVPADLQAGEPVAAPPNQPPEIPPGAFIGLVPALPDPAPALEAPAPALDELRPPDDTDAVAGQKPPSLCLRLEVDFAAAEAKIFVNTDSEPLRVALESGAWRVVVTPRA
ncbi:MAG: FHA domain-containing protein [Solirubrobacteraceae bacterium]